MSTILIVDDVQTDRQLAGKVASACGKDVEYAANGREAIEKAKRIHPDLILMDVVMPEQDGFATCRALKKDPETQAIPVVLVSSKGESADKFWGKKQGAEGYIVKPYTPDELSDVIQQYAQ